MITMKVVISVTLEIRKAEIEVAFLASAAFTITLIIGISGSSMRGICGGNVLLMNSTDSVSEYRGRGKKRGGMESEVVVDVLLC